MSLQEIEGNGSNVSCIIHESSCSSNRYCSEMGLSHPRHAFSWATPSLDSMQADQSANPPICGSSEINQGPQLFVYDLKDILQMPSFSQCSITSDSDFLPTAPGVSATVVRDLSTSPSKLCSSSREVRFDDYVKELIPGLDLVSRADRLNLFQRQDSINFVADAFMPKKDAGIRWSHALSNQVSDLTVDCACSEENLSYPSSSMEVSNSELVDDGRVCNSHEQNVSIAIASSSFVPAQTAAGAVAASVMFPSSDAMFNRASGTLAAVESVIATEPRPTTQNMHVEVPMVAEFSQLHGRQDESCGTNPPTEKMAPGESDLGIRVPAAEIGHGASNATTARYNLDARGADGNVVRTGGCGEVEGVPVFCDPAGMFSVPCPALFSPIMAGFPHAQAYPTPPLDPASMREMNYRVAAFRPTTDISIDAISRPKRKNVKISKDPQSVAARHRRERISDRIRVLQRLVPGGTKMDTASMLDEAIHYVKFLKTQVQAMQSLGSNGLGHSWSSIGGVFPSSALHSGASSCVDFGAANVYACSDAFPPRSTAQGSEKGSCSTSFPCLGQPLPDQFQLQQSCH